jgi:hypothetical protein
LQQQVHLEHGVMLYILLCGVPLLQGHRSAIFGRYVVEGRSARQPLAHRRSCGTAACTTHDRRDDVNRAHANRSLRCATPHSLCSLTGVYNFNMPVQLFVY